MASGFPILGNVECGVLNVELPNGTSMKTHKGASLTQHSTFNTQHSYKAHELTPSAVRAAISACTMAFTI